jgi:hypothetical protein
VYMAYNINRLHLFADANSVIHRCKIFDEKKLEFYRVQNVLYL